MADDFYFKHVASPSGSAGYRVRTASFGDGYSQSAADGINNKQTSWSVSIIGVKGGSCANIVNIDNVISFLDARAGYQSFTWTPPGGSQGKYISEQYTITKAGSLFTVSTTFTEVFR